MTEIKIDKLNGPQPTTKAVPEQYLRRLDHTQWLTQFALALETTPTRRGVEMTPFRAGAIGRLRLAVAYIELLRADLEKLSGALTASEHDLTLTLKANALLTEQIREHRAVDEALDRRDEEGR